MVRFNPTDPTCKSVVGALAENQDLCLSLKIRKDVGARRVFLCFFKDGEEQIYKRFLPFFTTDGGFDEHKAQMRFAQRGLYFYYFEVETEHGVKYVCRGEGQNAFLCDETGEFFQLTVYKKQKNNADWFKGGLVYHIFVDRFFKGGEHGYPDGAVVNGDWYAVPDHRPVNGEILNNEFFGGDIEGIRQKLDYVKSLGATVIYLSPIFKANSNHKYNTGDFLTVDEGFGNAQVFTRFVGEAKQKGIDVILDGVFSHTGDDSVYFNKYGRYDSVGAYQSQNSPYYPWFTFCDFPDKYKTWWGIDTLPEVNKTNESYRDFICREVIPKWFDFGVRGVRLDVADELPDAFLYPLCGAVKRQGDNIIIGEVWENATDKIAYGVRRRYFQGGQLDSVMNYPLKDGIIGLMTDGDGEKFKNLLLDQINNYPKDSLDKLFNLLSSHDTARILTALGGETCANKDEQAAAVLRGEKLDLAKRKLKAAAVLQYTLYGVPCLYYGDEAGLQGYGDPFCRRCYPWGREDGGLVEFYRQLGRLRKDKLFASAELRDIRFDCGVLSFERRDGKNGVKVFVNVGEGDAVVNSDGYDVVLGSERLAPYGFAVLKNKK